MHEFRKISSSQNSLVKKISVLQEKSRERKKTGLFVLEGWRELQLAIKGNYILDTVLVQEDLVSRDDLLELLDADVRDNSIVDADPGHSGSTEASPAGGSAVDTNLIDADSIDSKTTDADAVSIGTADNDRLNYKVAGISESAPEIISISGEVYQKLAYRGTTEGILALARSKSHSLDGLIIERGNPLILIAEAPEKPGNIGALLRTADAAGLDAVIIANPKTDLYNPNIIRSSVGCIFTNRIATGSTSEVLNYLRKNEISCYCAALTAAKKYIEVDYRKASAIVVGTEATGLSEDWLANSDQNIIIPMAGEIDSMNVSVSAAILIFEAKRQRGF
ncbi:MAG: RNA methyltransferase [Pricia sp.]